MKNLIAKGGAVLTLSSLATTFASFVRNIIVARIIGVEDFGIASLLALTMFAVEMISDLAVNKVIIQDAEGDRTGFLGSGHSFQIIRGIASASFVYLIAGSISKFFNIPQAQWAFEILALVPLVRGLVHLDLSRLQRTMNFAPVAMAEAIPQLATLLLALPLAMLTKDYSAMVWLILIQNLIFLSLSHYFSERSYLLAWDPRIVGRIFRFGWPLLLNGLLMFMILQGDKVLIGKFFSMRELGWYSAAFGLALAPAMLIMKVSYSLLLPVMSKVKDDLNQFSHHSEEIIQISLIISVGYTALISVLGAFLLTLLFGNDFANGAYLIAWLGLMQGVRIAKFGPFGSALAFGSTRIPLIANIARCMAFVVAVYALIHGATILQLVLVGIAGEIVAYWLGLLLLSKKIRLQLSRTFFVSAILWGSMIIAIVLPSEVEQMSPVGLPHSIAQVFWIVVFAIALKLLPRGTKFIVEEWKDAVSSDRS